MKSVLVLVVLFYAHLSLGSNGDRSYQYMSDNAAVMLVGTGGGYQCMMKNVMDSIGGGGSFMLLVSEEAGEGAHVFVTPEGQWLCLNEEEQGFTKCNDEQTSFLEKVCDGDDGGDDNQNHTPPVFL